MAAPPDHQGRGVGDALLGRLLAQVDHLAPAKAFARLFAAATGGGCTGGTASRSTPA
ncbi:MAG: hypothetical protein ACXV2H_02600 [Actinomycetes bacterium]